MAEGRNGSGTALISLGLIFVVVGIVLTITLRESVTGAGMGVFGLGVVFFVIGFARKRKTAKQGSEGDA
jgi:hypothetical protein